MTDHDVLSGRNIGEFVVGGPVDEGGFGRVYRCRQPALGREAILKVLHHKLCVQDVHIKRFLREAQLASRLDHPYAAHIYDFGAEESEGILWIAMEYVHGITLKRWLAERGPMPLAQFVPFFEKVAEVVQTAHDRGIIHRDLKPANVMMIERAGQLLPKLLDLGVAKLLDGELLPEPTPDTMKRLRAIVGERVPAEVLQQFRLGPSTVTDPSPSSQREGQGRLTPDHATIGTPGYMAPEQWSREFPVGPPADLFALGVVAFEALTSRRPFEGMSVAEFVDLDRPVTIPPLGGSFSPALAGVFQRALARRPRDRWGSALELAGALRAASGLGASRADLPRLEAGVRDAWLVGAPRPLAESLAVLDGARNAHQAHIAIQELVRSLLRYLLAVALVTRAQAHEVLDDPALLKLVRALDRRELSIEERVQLLRLLVRPPTGRRSAHPIPEFVELVTPGPDGADGLDPILALHATMDHAVVEDVVRPRLYRLIAVLAQLLRRTMFVLDYVLVVPRDHAAERWAGVRRQELACATATAIDSELVDAHPMLLGRNGRVCVDLWPLVQAAPPTEGAEPELFVFDGHSSHGALLIAAPSGFEHHDAAARDWVATHVIAEIESKLRMRDQIRVAAHQWQARGRPNALLWRGEVLADLERWMRHTAGAAPLSDIEAAFVATSRRAGRRTRWIWRSLVALAITAVLAGIQYHAALQTRDAQQQARMAQQLEALRVTQSEIEAGRQALLHDDSVEAQIHLLEAYRRGDHSPGTTFMLSRALQPRMAEQARFTAVAGRMWSAAFSPDGRQIVTTDDACARVWDARTNQLLFTLPGNEVYQAVYSADGTRLVTVAEDIVQIWDAASGTLVHALKYNRKDGKPPNYYIAAISRDRKLVAAIDAMGEVAHVWNAGTGAPLAELRNDGSEFPAIAFSRDGRWLATSGGDRVLVFDTSTWAEVTSIAGPSIHTLSFDPTEPRLATGTAGGDAAIWSVPSGTRLRHLREVGEPIDRLAFSPDGKLVVTASRDGTEQIWITSSGALQSQGNYLRSKIRSVEFDSQSRLVVAAGASGAVAIADAALGMPVAVFEGPRNVVQVAHFNPSSRRVVGASWDGTARVWDATSPYRRWSSPPISVDCGLSPSLEPDGRFVAIGCRDNPTRVWDTAHDQLVAELPSVTHVDGDFSSALPAVSHEGDRAAIARGNSVEIYELPGGRLIRTIAHSAAVTAVAFASTGHDLISGSTDGSVLITRDGRDPLALPISGGGIDAAAFVADGRVVVADARSRLRVYRSDHNTVVADLAAPIRAGALRLSPDGLRMITIPGYNGQRIPPMLWDLERYRPIAQLEDHLGQVFSVRFVGGGDEILTAGGDGMARMWDSATGRLHQTYRGGARFLADAALNPDGTMVVAGDADGLLRFWDAATARPLWTLPVHRSHVIGIHFDGDDLVTRGFGGEISRWTLPRPDAVIEACRARNVVITDEASCAIVPK